MMNYVCQQCKEPLLLDASLVELSPSQYDMIATSLPSSPSTHTKHISDVEQPTPQHPSSSSSKAVWKQANNPENIRHTALAHGKQLQRSYPAPNESFVILKDSVIHNIPSQLPSVGSAEVIANTRHSNNTTKGGSTIASHPQPESDYPNPTPISHHLRSTMRLFNLLSSRTDIDHPLCAECTQILLSSLQRKLDETKKERDGYIAFDKEVRKEKERESQEMNRDEVEHKIERLKSEERAILDQLKFVEREREQLDEELRALELEERALDEEEAEKLERTNVYNDAFCIGHDGVFGTINGLRLGRVPGAPVEWSEINAAWGQTLLLLYTIARKLDFTFENYRLVPMGSFSRIERTLGDKATYELYGSGDLHFGRLLHNRRFDFAMVAFLECLKQLMDYANSQDSNIEFPHQIIKDKIGEASIKLQFSQEESWTRALRHVLLALKIILKWTTNGGNG
ncbi:APG6-domain-containing protein [Pisolithus microcarpus]|nr:APG6-domain-containing protein [Pisolithus microcarpus]